MMIMIVDGDDDDYNNCGDDDRWCLYIMFIDDDGLEW